MNGIIKIGSGKDRPVRQHHPWMFSGAVIDTDGSPQPGDIVDVVDMRGEWLARGYFNPRSQIVVRLLTWDRDEQIDRHFWMQRLAAAAAMRDQIGIGRHATAYRMVFAESDLLPGLIVDRYGDWLSVQWLTLGVDLRRTVLTELLHELWAPAGIVDRSDPVARRQEGLTTGPAEVVGQRPPEELEIIEDGMRFPVNLLGGQKTGFYLDQRFNRSIVARHAAGRRVLNAFSFTGAFAVHALKAGALHVTNVDTSHDALVGSERALRMNGLDPDAQAEAIVGDVFQVLRSYRDDGRQFDLVILDPPKFARSKSELEPATRGYKDINLIAMKLLAPGGLLATFSCSGLVTPDLFQKIVFGASVDAGRSMQIVARMTQAPDHPVLLTFPEGEYLKGLLARAV